MMQMPGTDAVPPPVVSSRRRTSALAILALIFGILSICTLGLMALPGLALGIIGLIRVRRSGGRLTGQGMAIGGIITSVVGLLLLALLAVAACWYFMEHVQSRGFVMESPMTEDGAIVETMVGLSNLGDAARSYAAEHGGRLPAASDYPEALRPYMDPAQGQALVVPRGRRFAMNAGVAGMCLKTIGDPHWTVVFFEVEPDGPYVAGRELLETVMPGIEEYVMAFADGSVRQVSEEELGQVIWQPDQKPVRAGGLRRPGEINL